VAGTDGASRPAVLVAGIAFVVAAVVGAIAALALSSGPSRHVGGASAAVPAPSTPKASDRRTSGTSTSTRSPSGTPSRSPASLPGQPDRTSGGLTARTLPSAGSLGVGWTYRVDRGSAEAGYVGNGTPTLARDPHEVVLTAVPLGCEQRSQLPVPAHVLETDYRQRARGTAGVGLRLRFSAPAAAGRFEALRREDLEACARQPLEPGDGGVHLVSGVRSSGRGTYVSARTDASLPAGQRTWTEVAAWIGGRDVVLLAVNAAPGSPVADVARLSEAAGSILR